MARYVALIRGINVGGNNVIRMVDLRACFEQQGFANVATFIQSGNVVFDSTGGAAKRLSRRIETALQDTFECSTTVVLCSQRQLRRIVECAPMGFGAAPTKYRCDVIFLGESLSAQEAIEQIPMKPGVDQVNAGPGALYFSRLSAKASRSRLSRVVALPIYKSMTIRNWNTTTKLLQLMDRI
jgi:uncharacterized protein (DUF1697 family)